MRFNVIEKARKSLFFSALALFLFFNGCGGNNTNTDSADTDSGTGTDTGSGSGSGSGTDTDSETGTDTGSGSGNDSGSGPATLSGHIVFASNRTGKYQIYRKDAANQTNISNSAYDDIQPCVSPDGGKVAFVSDQTSSYCSTGYCDMYIIDADGIGRTQITNTSSRSVYDLAYCVWSSDGTKVYFGGKSTSSVWSYEQIWVVNSDGTGQQMILSKSESEIFPMGLSSDGAKLSLYEDKWFASAPLDLFWLSTVNMDGTGYSDSPSACCDALEGRWSPDGAKYAFVKYSGNNYATGSQIHVMDGSWSDYPGTAIVELDYNWNPCWSPDGSRIVFSSGTSSSDQNIYIVNSDGSGKTQLTAESDNRWPVWVDNLQ